MTGCLAARAGQRPQGGRAAGPAGPAWHRPRRRRPDLPIWLFRLRTLLTSSGNGIKAAAVAAATGEWALADDWAPRSTPSTRLGSGRPDSPATRPPTPTTSHCCSTVWSAFGAVTAGRAAAWFPLLHRGAVTAGRRRLGDRTGGRRHRRGPSPGPRGGERRLGYDPVFVPDDLVGDASAPGGILRRDVGDREGIHQPPGPGVAGHRPQLARLP